MSCIDVYVDGSCLNSGQKHIAQGGIGVFWGPDHRDNVSEPMKGPPTSTGAELQAATRAINIARQRGYSSLRIFTDSETVKSAHDHIDERRRNNWTRYNEYKLRMETIADRNSFEQLETALNNYRRSVTIVHVDGHSRNQHNAAADRLAREGAKQYRTGYY